MFALNLIARAGFALPHRRLNPGDTLARIEFDNENDAMWFQRTLRWNAFGFVKAPAIEGHVIESDGSRTPMETGDVITADLFDLIAGADPEELAKLKGIGPKKAAEIIENAQAFVAERAEAEAKAKADAEANPS